MKRRREAMERKRGGGFYSKTAGKGFDDMDEGTSFWGHKGLQRRFGKVNGEKPGGLDGCSGLTDSDGGGLFYLLLSRSHSQSG